MLPQRTPARRPAPSPARTPRKRRHLHLIDPTDGAEILPDRRVYTHEQLTPWKVEMATDDPTHAEYRASFRAVASEEQEYVVFTLTPPRPRPRPPPPRPPQPPHSPPGPGHLPPPRSPPLPPGTRLQHPR